MPTYNTPKKNTAYKFYIGLVDQSNTKILKANPTIASGDFKVSIDGGAFANLTTLPSANPASGRAVMIDLSAAEMNGDNIVVQCVDAAGAEWCDQIINLATTARQIDDLAYPATPGRAMVVDAAGLVDSNMVKAGPSGSGTAQTTGDLYALAATIAGYLDSEIAAILAKVTNLPSDPADASDIAAAFSALNTLLSSTGIALTAAERNAIADAHLDRADAIEVGLTPRQAHRLEAAAAAGKLSGAASTSVVIRNAVADSKNRISATVDADGNRSAITVDLT